MSASKKSLKKERRAADRSARLLPFGGEMVGDEKGEKISAAGGRDSEESDDGEQQSGSIGTKVLTAALDLLSNVEKTMAGQKMTDVTDSQYAQMVRNGRTYIANGGRQDILTTFIDNGCHELLFNVLDVDGLHEYRRKYDNAGLLDALEGLTQGSDPTAILMVKDALKRDVAIKKKDGDVNITKVAWQQYCKRLASFNRDNRPAIDTIDGQKYVEMVWNQTIPLLPAREALLMKGFGTCNEGIRFILGSPRNEPFVRHLETMKYSSDDNASKPKQQYPSSQWSSKQAFPEKTAMNASSTKSSTGHRDSSDSKPKCLLICMGNHDHTECGFRCVNPGCRNGQPTGNHLARECMMPGSIHHAKHAGVKFANAASSQVPSTPIPTAQQLYDLHRRMLQQEHDIRFLTERGNMGMESVPYDVPSQLAFHASLQPTWNGPFSDDEQYHQMMERAGYHC